MKSPSERDVAVNYQEDGSLLFIALMDDGDRMAELTISPDRRSFTMDIWYDKIRRGKILTLYREARGMENNFPYELRSWLRDVTSWEEPNSKWQRHSKFQIEGRTFEVRFNVRTGAIRFVFPELMIVSDRLRLADSYRELYKMAHGKVNGLLADLVVESGEHLGLQVANDQMPTTVTFNEVHRNFLGPWKVFTAYDSQNDVIMLQMGRRTVDSHICLIEEDLPEWRYIAKGEFREKVMEILSNNGIDLDECSGI